MYAQEYEIILFKFNLCFLLLKDVFGQTLSIVISFKYVKYF